MSMSVSITEAIEDEFIVYGKLEERKAGGNGILFIHSTITKEFLKRLYIDITKKNRAAESKSNISAYININSVTKLLDASSIISRAGLSDEELAPVRKSLEYLIGSSDNPDQSVISDEYIANLKIVTEHFNKVLIFAAKNPDIYLKSSICDAIQDGYLSQNPLFYFDESALGGPIAARTCSFPAMLAIGHTDNSKTMKVLHMADSRIALID